jgi:hypothetical protein
MSNTIKGKLTTNKNKVSKSHPPTFKHKHIFKLKQDEGFTIQKHGRVFCVQTLTQKIFHHPQIHLVLT